MLSKTQIKYIQSLGQKKQRDEQGLFIAEGPKIIDELLVEENCFIQNIYATNDWINKNKIERALEVTEVTDDELKKISQLKTPHEVLLIAKKIKWTGNIETSNTITIVLDTIQDPGNMGTIIRLADWFGIKNIISSPECADEYNPKVVQASMGSIVRVRVASHNLKEWFSKNKVVKIYAATLNGKNVSQMGKLKEGIILIGNESKGIQEEILGFADERITIQKKGKAESLNAAIATGIILSHLT